ncbi:MAG: beta-N-acetylhexosaminidase [Candidatus Zixiibacteriota bacterium]
MSFPDLVPRPVTVEPREGAFELTPDVVITTGSPSSEVVKTGDYLRSRIETLTGRRLTFIPTANHSSNRSVISLDLKKKSERFPPEAYELVIETGCVRIEAATFSGLFYGVQTFLQLMPCDDVQDSSILIPAVRIEDYPRFVWRGMHLDVSRHFFGREHIKKYLDLLAYHKFNVFHWHLTDDQGWRVEIKKYPELTDIGGWRVEADGRRYGGFYTQDDIRDIVAYAAERAVTIVPEIDIPGHAGALLAACPEYSCNGNKNEVVNEWGVFEHVLCPGREETFTFLRNLFEEITALFPGQYIHVGGDECVKTPWQNHDLCQKRKAEQKLADENELQSYFIRRVEIILNSLNRRLIGWDEILEGGLAEQATVMSWRGIEGAVRAARAGHDAVLCPQSHCYFDHYQAESGEPKAIGGLTPYEKTYAFEPVPDGLTETEAQHILGAQGNVWTEYIADFKHVEYMALPRLCALAEVVWSPKSLRNLADFKRRLRHHYRRLDRMGINYRRS